MATTASPRKHYATEGSLIVEEMEGGEAHVGEFFLAQRGHVVRREVRSLWCIASRYGGRRRASCQRKRQTGYSERRYRGFGHSLLFRSLLCPLHGRILQSWKKDLREHDPTPSEQGRQDSTDTQNVMIAFIFMNGIVAFSSSTERSRLVRIATGAA
ncbi:hypothetical protein [Bradyrhizobium sp. UFLA05-112]